MADATPTISRYVSIRNAFFSGVILVAPICLTVWVFSKIIDFVGGTFKPLFLVFVPGGLRDRPGLEAVWSILATLIVMALVALLGYVSRYVFGKFFFSMGDRFIQTIPGVNAVYNTVRQIVNTFSSQSRHMFNKVVLVEFPRKGSWTIGFLTNTVQGEAQEKAGKEIWTIFVPTTPNPTSGFLLMMPRAEVIELDMAVGEGMKMIISGGAVTPPGPQSNPKRSARRTSPRDDPWCQARRSRLRRSSSRSGPRPTPSRPSGSSPPCTGTSWPSSASRGRPRRPRWRRTSSTRSPRCSRARTRAAPGS